MSGHERMCCKCSAIERNTHLVLCVHQPPAEAVQHHANGVPAVVRAAGTHECKRTHIRDAGGRCKGRAVASVQSQMSRPPQQMAPGAPHLTRAEETSTTRCCPPASFTASATLATPCRAGAHMHGAGVDTHGRLHRSGCGVGCRRSSPHPRSPNGRPAVSPPQQTWQSTPLADKKPAPLAAKMTPPAPCSAARSDCKDQQGGGLNAIGRLRQTARGRRTGRLNRECNQQQCNPEERPPPACL